MFVCQQTHLTPFSQNMACISGADRINPLPNDKFQTLAKLKEFADDNFKFEKNSNKFSKSVENHVRKGEIAHYEQFLLFPLCFQKTSIADT